MASSSDTTRVHYAAASASTPPAEGEPQRSTRPSSFLSDTTGSGSEPHLHRPVPQVLREDVESDLEHRPRVHLVVVEEPEVHMHPQMQAVFVQKVSEFLTPAAGETGVQLLLTTHHRTWRLTAASRRFVRYFRRNNGTVEIKDLLSFESSAMTDPEKAAMEFLRKYLTTTRCDMFFADKLVFIEGQVERMLLPRQSPRWMSHCATS